MMQTYFDGPVVDQDVRKNQDTSTDSGGGRIKNGTLNGFSLESCLVADLCMKWKQLLRQTKYD